MIPPHPPNIALQNLPNFGRRPYRSTQRKNKPTWPF
jgi:hypothetical protein